MKIFFVRLHQESQEYQISNNNNKLCKQNSGQVRLWAGGWLKFFGIAQSGFKSSKK
jgi:hypothetical protein